MTIPGDAAGSVAGVLPPDSILRAQENKKGAEEEGKGEADTKLNTGNWNKGSYDNAEQSLQKHFEKHGDEVGAKDPQQYLRKAEEFAKTAKKGSTKSPVSGAVEGVIRYKKNGKYIDLAPDGSIISFGKQ